LLVDWIKPSSLIDVGCGEGAWLSIFRHSGVERVVGVDGVYVNQDRLLIPSDCFLAADLSEPSKINIQKTYDLAVCLEVAEHLPSECAMPLVRFLTRLAPVILFSAAIPNQGGTNHINEQWPDYWVAIFEKCGFTAIDCIRPRLWSDDDVDWWYAQNTFLFLNQSELARYPQLVSEAKLHAEQPLVIVHPKAYVKSLEWTRGMYELNHELMRIAPTAGTFIFVDEQQLIAPGCGRAKPFLECDGAYYGPPPSDDIAINELSRMIGEGAEFIAFAWTAFWWLDYYKKFADHLRSKFPWLHASQRLVVFDLQKHG